MPLSFVINNDELCIALELTLIELNRIATNIYWDESLGKSLFILTKIVISLIFKNCDKIATQ